MRLAAILIAFASCSRAWSSVEEITALRADGRPIVRLTVEPAPEKGDVHTALIDGESRTSHYADSRLWWRPGTELRIEVDFQRPRLLSAVYLGYAGGLKADCAEVLDSGAWTALPTEVWEDRKAPYPQTCWLLAQGLAAPAEALRLRCNTAEDQSAQITELRLFGFPADETARLADLAISPRLPTAFREAEALVDLRHTPGESARQLQAEVQLRDSGNGSVVAAARVTVEPKPLRSVTVRVPLRMPAPGRYSLSVSEADLPGSAISTPVYVTARELQFIWYGAPAEAQWATMVTNVSEPPDVAFWLRRGVVPLAWAGGYSKRTFDTDQFAEYWTSRLQRHPAGIAIDEFPGGPGQPIDLYMANALLRTRRAEPAKQIVVWQAGVAPPEAAQAYAASANWVIPECYMNYLNNKLDRFDLRIAPMRAAGLMHKTVMGVSCTQAKIGTTAAGLEEQIRYLRRLAPEMPGLGFYKAYGSGRELVSVADALCFKYFVGPTLLAVKDRRRDGGVLVRNIGAMNANDVRFTFSAGPVVQVGRIDRLAADEVCVVFPDPAEFAGVEAAVYQIQPSTEYSDVSERIEVTPVSSPR
jgi:hypothetical protein